MLLVRDVTDVRKRDRLLISKDATIREIHHRVKNNLQTISSLLRLQARRLLEPGGQGGRSPSRCAGSAPSPSSTSRCRASPATTSRSSRSSARCCASPRRACSRPTGPCEFSLAGDGGRIPARVATPLSVVLTELMQNAVDHGFPEGSGGGTVVVVAGATTARS